MVVGYENLLGEFVGTMVLLVFGCGVCANLTLERSKGQASGWVNIATMRRFRARNHVTDVFQFFRIKYDHFCFNF